MLSLHEETETQRRMIQCHILFSGRGGTRAWSLSPGGHPADLLPPHSAGWGILSPAGLSRVRKEGSPKVYPSDHPSG